MSLLACRLLNAHEQISSTHDAAHDVRHEQLAVHAQDIRYLLVDRPQVDALQLQEGKYQEQQVVRS